MGDSRGCPKSSLREMEHKISWVFVSPKVLLSCCWLFLRKYKLASRLFCRGETRGFLAEEHRRVRVSPPLTTWQPSSHVCYFTRAATAAGISADRLVFTSLHAENQCDPLAHDTPTRPTVALAVALPLLPPPQNGRSIPTAVLVSLRTFYSLTKAGLFRGCTRLYLASCCGVPLAQPYPTQPFLLAF